MSLQNLPNLLDLADQYSIDLELRGNRYWGCCPFHEEDTPSFSIDIEGGMFKCFGCGQGGGVLKFISLWEGISVEDVKKRFEQKSFNQHRHLADLQNLLTKCGRASEPKQRDVLSLIKEANRKVYLAWDTWCSSGKKDLEAQRSNASYKENFHKLFAREQLWEMYWEDLENIIGDLIWSIHRGHYDETGAVLLMRMASETPT